MRTDDAGDTLWTRVLDDPSPVAAERRGAAGGDVVVASYPFPRYYLTRIDTLGAVVWSQSYGRQPEPGLCARGARRDQLCQHWRPIACGMLSHDLLLESSAFIMKVDQNGGLIWCKFLGGDDQDGFRNVIETADGGFLATGYHCDSLNAPRQMMAARFDSNGSFLWMKRYPTADESCAGSGRLPGWELCRWWLRLVGGNRGCCSDDGSGRRAVVTRLWTEHELLGCRAGEQWVGVGVDQGQWPVAPGSTHGARHCWPVQLPDDPLSTNTGQLLPPLQHDGEPWGRSVDDHGERHRSLLLPLTATVECGSTDVTPMPTVAPSPAHPNPTTGPVRIAGISGSSLFSVLDPMGRSIIRGRSAPSGIIDLSSVPAGVHVLAVDDGTTQRIARVVVER
ncbi:MAG: T9SS type A sorting domain-containing protein [Flavobacteriales bacterium]|nr:T9SS type A sorting domain-containing protein [Flavobacteriales bacterium]